MACHQTASVYRRWHVIKCFQIDTVVHSNTAIAAAAAVARLMLTAIAALLGPAQHGKQPVLRRDGHAVSSTVTSHVDRSLWVHTNVAFAALGTLYRPISWGQLHLAASERQAGTCQAILATSGTAND